MGVAAGLSRLQAQPALAHSPIQPLTTARAGWSEKAGPEMTPPPSVAAIPNPTRQNSHPTRFRGCRTRISPPTTGATTNDGAISATTGRSVAGAVAKTANPMTPQAATSVAAKAARGEIIVPEASRTRRSAGGDGLLLRPDNDDSLVEAGQAQDLAVVVGQPEREKLLALPLGPHEQRDE